MQELKVILLIFFTHFNIKDIYIQFEFDMTVCIKQTTKKYKLRGSPPYSAMDCSNSVKKGNDGLTYTSKPDKTGIYRWVKTKQLIKNKTMKTTNVTSSQNNTKCVYKKNVYGSVDVSKFIKCILNDTLKKQLEGDGKPKHIYEINDNAAFPFVVFDYGGRVDIYNNHFNESTNKEELKDKIMGVNYEKIFVGDNESNDPYWHFKRGIAKGNTILLQTRKDKYLIIGKGIMSFSTKDGDIIRKFYSSIGGNYDSFPYAVGEKYVYLLNDKKYAPVEEFDIKKDVIKQYYCYDCECKKYKTMNLPMKTIYAPFYDYY
jgi:hypothetical protein